MKQTAVEFLQECLSIHLSHQQQVQFEGLFQQAKEMEKEQMIDFTMDYVNSGSIFCLWDIDSAPELDIDTSAEQYYDQTFNTKER